MTTRFACVTPADRIKRAAALYAGRDPDSGRALTPADSGRMVGAAIAAELGVHPHTVDGWIQRFGWTRPGWYKRHRGYRPQRPAVALPALRTLIAGLVAKGGDAGQALPSNTELAARFGCSLQAVIAALRALRRAGEIDIERSGPLRRLMLKDADGNWIATAWSSLTAGWRGPANDRRDGQRSALDEALLQAIRGWAQAGRPFPSDKAAAREIGCAPSSIGQALRGLVRAGCLELDRDPPNGRRARLADGSATAWSPRVGHQGWGHRGGSTLAPAPGPIDPTVARAVTALRRSGGTVVFDAAVTRGGPRGVAWLVDGRMVDRARLLARAAASALA